MKIIGILTEDFSVYHDLVNYMKEHEIPFESLEFDEDIPTKVGVVITTEGEEKDVRFDKKVVVNSETRVPEAVNEARMILLGKSKFKRLVIGIDPGKRPGIAVIADGEVVETKQAMTPEDVHSIIRHFIDTYPSERRVIKIGHGDPTHRNRIINALLDMRVRIEMVDETSTTERTDFPDIKAAISIAMSEGKIIRGKYNVTPTRWELKDIQRQSRIRSNGTMTISKELAEKVAQGSMTLDKAIEEQAKKFGKNGEASYRRNSEEE